MDSTVSRLLERMLDTAKKVDRVERMVCRFTQGRKRNSVKTLFGVGLEVTDLCLVPGD